MAQVNIEPPSFVCETKTYAEYKEDLKRWSRLTSLEKKHQADMVIYRLDGHPSGIKEKIRTISSQMLQFKRAVFSASKCIFEFFRHCLLSVTALTMKI